MSNRLSAQAELRMMVLPGESTGNARRGARSSAAFRRTSATQSGARSDPAEQRTDPAEQPRGDERTAHKADHYANAGPDCYWLEAG